MTCVDWLGRHPIHRLPLPFSKMPVWLAVWGVLRRQLQRLGAPALLAVRASHLPARGSPRQPPSVGQGAAARQAGLRLRQRRAADRLGQGVVRLRHAEAVPPHEERQCTAKQQPARANTAAPSAGRVQVVSPARSATEEHLCTFDLSFRQRDCSNEEARPFMHGGGVLQKQQRGFRNSTALLLAQHRRSVRCGVSNLAQPYQYEHVGPVTHSLARHVPLYLHASCD